MRQFPWIFLTSVIIVAPSLADDYQRQPGIDALHYVFKLTLADDVDQILGEARIDLRFVEDGLTGFSLDLATPSGEKGMTVAEITSAGKPVAHEHRADKLRVTLDAAPRAGERRSFVVRYQGIPANGLRILANKYRERTFFSENWPDRARQWLPMIDHPHDKATSEFLVTAPSKYQVVSNGTLQEEVDLGDGRRLTHWKQSVPIASWLNAVGVAQFATRHVGTVRGIPLQTWVYHQDRDLGIVTFEGPARRALAFFDEQVGPFPYEKLGNVQAAGISGGTEHASAIFYGERSVANRPATGLVAHEIAHQWFGNSVTESDWDDVWLSEGFATYFTLLFTEHDRGRDAFVADLKRSRETVFAAERRHPGVAVIHDNLKDMRRVLNPIVYQKGSWTLHMLRSRIGTDAFWSGIREYYRRHRDGLASTDDFRRVMEETAGVDLSGFFDQWLRRPGSPSIEGHWRFDPQNGRVIIDLVQSQAAEVYSLPLEFGLTFDGAGTSRVEALEMSERQLHHEIRVDKEPVSVSLDPNTNVLMQSKFERR